MRDPFDSESEQFTLDQKHTYTVFTPKYLPATSNYEFTTETTLDIPLKELISNTKKKIPHQHVYNVKMKYVHVVRQI